MSSWRDQILRAFTPRIARLTLVADPDGLLLEEGVLQRVQARGFEVVPYDDHVAFRYTYESRFRRRWDAGLQAHLVIVLDSPSSELGHLPYDLLAAGRQLSFHLGDVFPNLSYPVVTSVNRSDLDALYEAQCKYAPGPLGDNATKEFVLRHVFEIAPELIKQPTDLLRVLLRLHYLGRRLPDALSERLTQLLRQNGTLTDWPLETLIPDREAFFAFLQERWPIFLERMAKAGEPAGHDDPPTYGVHTPGPVHLAFDHHDIRVYIDNLFLEGLLQPVTHDHAAVLSQSWIAVGVQTDPAKDRTRRLTRLIDSLAESVPQPNARHTDWFHFARPWAELILAWNESAAPLADSTRDSMAALQEQVDTAFSAWVLQRFAGLVNLPPVPPVMVHHLARFLARQVADDERSKVALLLVDGLSLDQWLVIRNVLAEQQPMLRFREQAVFAWIPSLTSVSRQAVFAGKAPFLFPNTVHTTDKEPDLWRRFWADQGLTAHQVVYAKGLGEGSLETLSESLSHPRVRAAGLVIDKVDRIMHGMEMGTAGMHDQVRLWAEHPYLGALLNLLLSTGFTVYLSSDHGNIEAEGCGSPAEGVLADRRGERVRIYSDASLRRSVAERFAAAVEWETIGLPDSYLPLLASGRGAFVRAGERIVTHGGISLEELVVPLVHIERKNP